MSVAVISLKRYMLHFLNLSVSGLQTSFLWSCLIKSFLMPALFQTNLYTPLNLISLIKKGCNVHLLHCNIFQSFSHFFKLFFKFTSLFLLLCSLSFFFFWIIIIVIYRQFENHIIVSFVCSHLEIYFSTVGCWTISLFVCIYCLPWS